MLSMDSTAPSEAEPLIYTWCLGDFLGCCASVSAIIVESQALARVLTIEQHWKV
jgi:hypothetical protein